MQLTLKDPDFLFDPYARPMPYPPGTLITYRDQLARVVQGMTNAPNGNFVPYTAPGTVSIRYRYGAVLVTSQVPLSWVSVGDVGTTDR